MSLGAGMGVEAVVLKKDKSGQTPLLEQHLEAS